MIENLHATILIPHSTTGGNVCGQREAELYELLLREKHAASEPGQLVVVEQKTDSLVPQDKSGWLQPS